MSSQSQPERARDHSLARGYSEPSGLRRFVCRWLGWHSPGEEFAYEVWFGTATQTLCRCCRKPILEDSQGNWFTFDGTPQFRAAIAKAEPQP